MQKEIKDMRGHEMCEGFELGTAKNQDIRHQNLEKKKWSLERQYFKIKI